MPSQIHQNDTVQFIVTISNDNGVVNISTANITQLIFQRPLTCGNLVVNANFLTDGSDGNISYITQSGDLGIVGLYKLQAYVQIGPSGWRSNIVDLKVSRNLCY